MMSFMRSGTELRGKGGRQDLFYVALAHGLRLAQHPYLGKPLVAALLEHLGDVARTGRPGLAEHPLLDRIPGLPRRRLPHERGRTEHVARESVGRRWRHAAEAYEGPGGAF